MEGYGNQGLKATNTIGKIQIYFKILFMIIFSILFLVGGSYFIKYGFQYKQTKATISENSICRIDGEGKNKCSTKMEYKNSDGNKLSGIVGGGNKYNKGQKIDIFYNSNGVIVTTRISLIAGSVFIILSILLMIGAIYEYLMTTNSKAYNSATGAGVIKNTVFG